MNTINIQLLYDIFQSDWFANKKLGYTNKGIRLHK